jgi:hypothetical protein
LVDFFSPLKRLLGNSGMITILGSLKAVKGIGAESIGLAHSGPQLPASGASA